MPSAGLAANWSAIWSAKVLALASGADFVGSSQVRWKAISVSVYTARTVTMSMEGLKLRGSTMTCPASGKAEAGCWAQKGAAGSSGMEPAAGRTVSIVAKPGLSWPSDVT